MSTLRFPETVRELVARRYRSRHRFWLAGEGRWPLPISLGVPTEEQAFALPANLPAWVQAWREWRGPGEVVWSERRWRTLGVQRLPERLIVESAGDAALLAGEERRWRQALGNFQRLVARWPGMSTGLPRWYDALAELDAGDIQRLQALLAWLERNPASQLFPRQAPISGMDTKWLEPRLPLVAGLLACIRGEEGAGMSAYDSCGLRESPQLVRLRILDGALRRHAGGMSDFSAPLSDLCALQLPAGRVYIVENVQTGLAFEERRGSVVAMGLGYGVSALAKVPWIASAECVYWGDLDTHGFSILNRARSALPRVRSMLMDEATLLRRRDLWVVEGEQCSMAELPLLTEAERAVYRGLKEQRWGRNVRLEQERIAWNEAWETLQREEYGES